MFSSYIFISLSFAEIIRSLISEVIFLPSFIKVYDIRLLVADEIWPIRKSSRRGWCLWLRCCELSVWWLRRGGCYCYYGLIMHR